MGVSVGALILVALAVGIGEVIAAILIGSASASTRLLLALAVAWPVVLILVRRFQGTPFLQTFGIRGVSASGVVLGGLSGLALGMLILSLVSYIPGPPPRSALEFHDVLSRSNRASLLVAMLVVGPLGEELLFRGWLLPLWLKRFGKAPAILGTALLFSLVHVLSWRVMLAFPIGCLLGWLTVRTGSVVPAVVGHAAANGASSLLEPVLRLAGLSSGDVAALGAVPWWLPCGSILVLTACVVALYSGGGWGSPGSMIETVAPATHDEVPGRVRQ